MEEVSCESRMLRRPSVEELAYSELSEFGMSAWQREQTVVKGDGECIQSDTALSDQYRVWLYVQCCTSTVQQGCSPDIISSHVGSHRMVGIRLKVPVI